jgi:bacterioferritin-associated ferredoxin
MNQILKSMTQEELDAVVQTRVEAALSSREDAEARAAAEEALKEAKETFETLKASLEAKDAKIIEYEEALANLDVSTPTEAEVAANEKIVELEAALEEANDRAAVAQAALDTIAREETAASRMAELDEAGVTLDEENAEAQYTKIRDMSDEEFQSYKSELIALRAKFDVADSEESEEDKVLDLADLDENEVKEIAERLGCDTADSKCVELVQQVVAKVAEVSAARTTSSSEEADASEGEKTETEETASEETPQKEVASLSTGEAIAKALDQELRPNLSMKAECAQAWENVYAKKRGEKNSE